MATPHRAINRMPPKKKGGKKKGKEKAVVRDAIPIPHDLSEPCPIDAHDGLLGIEHPSVKERVHAARTDLVLWRTAEALRNGDLDLELSGYSLEELPEELFDLPWLQVLDISSNLFVNDVFEDLALMTSLKALNLATNLLHGCLPPSIGALAAGLEELCLDENVISEIPDHATNLVSLEWFSARRNVITTLPGSCLRAWDRLAHLDLRSNRLAALPEEIGCCAGLEVLYLSGNLLKELPTSLGACSALRVLHASKNALTDLPESLSTLALLEELDVSFNQLARLPEAVLAGMPALRILLAANNKLENLPAVSIAAMSNLEVISLAGNNIKTVPEELGVLAKLREAYFNGNPISSLPASLAGWTSLVEGSFKFCKLKALPPEFAESWSHASTIDLRAKKKDTCKVSAELKDSLRKVHMLGALVQKPKKKTKGK